MPRYVIEREIPNAGSMNQEELREAALKSLEAAGRPSSRIQWLHSYVTDDKVYCVYIAPDEESVREHAQATGMPANRISTVRRLLDPTNYA